MPDRVTVKLLDNGDYVITETFWNENGEERQTQHVWHELITAEREYTFDNGI